MCTHKRGWKSESRACAKGQKEATPTGVVAVGARESAAEDTMRANACGGVNAASKGER